MLNSLTSIKKASLALGVAGIGVLVGLPALAQSPSSNGSQYFRESSEIRMSSEGMEILCKVTPINSRCEGSPYYNSGASSQPVESDTTTPPSGTTAPTQTLPSETDEGQPQGEGTGGMMQSPGMMQDGSSGSDSTTTPSGTAPEGQPAGDSMQQGTPSDNSTSPSGTTAPTQSLPSESPSK